MDLLHLIATAGPAPDSPMRQSFVKGLGMSDSSEREKFEQWAIGLRRIGAASLKADDNLYLIAKPVEDICRWIAAQERQREERERDEATRAMR